MSDKELVERLEALLKEATFQRYHLANSAERTVRWAKHEATLIAAIQRIEELAKDAERLDFIEDPARTYWITIQTQPNANHIRAEQGAGTRAAIDAAIKEEGNG